MQIKLSANKHLKYYWNSFKFVILLIPFMKSINKIIGIVRLDISMVYELLLFANV